MNVATLKSLLYFVAVVLFGGLAYFAVQHKKSTPWQYWDRDYAKSVLDQVTEPETPVAHIVNYEGVVKPVLMSFDWTGAPPRKVEEVAAETTGPVEKPKVVVSDLITVLATQVDTGDPGGSRAFVSWKKPEHKSQKSDLRIGRVMPAPYDSAVVKDIRFDGVEFAFSGEDQPNEVVLVPRAKDMMVIVDDEGNLRTRDASRVFPTAAPASNAWPKTTRRLATDIFEIGEDELTTFGRDYSRILTEDVRTETYFKDGRRAGLKLTEVKPGSLASQHGAQSGDVVISINGHGVSSEQEAIKFIKNNADTTTVWQVVIENLGRQRTVTYNTPSKD